MSHFTVAVLLDGTKTLEKIMAPYEEQYGEFEEYTVFTDETDTYRKEYENDTITAFKNERGYIPETAFETYPTSTGKSRWEYACEQYGSPVEVNKNQVWNDFDSYCSYMQYECNNGRWGYWNNPDGYWDYWLEIEPSEYWEDKPSERPTAANVLEIKADTNRIEYLRDVYRRIVENDKAKKAGKPIIHDVDIVEAWSYGETAVAAESEEEFVDKMSKWHPYAVVTPDGKWHAAGEMGWWGISSDTGREALDWVDESIRIIGENGDCHVAILDCHI